MKSELNFHDGSIESVASSIKDSTLALRITLADGQKCDLVFRGVFGWAFSLFEWQNFLLDLKTHDAENLYDSLIEDYEVEEIHVDPVRAGKALLFELDPATGMGGYVVAVNVEVYINR